MLVEHPTKTMAARLQREEGATWGRSMTTTYRRYAARMLEFSDMTTTHSRSDEGVHLHRSLEGAFA
jgi:hypothetical protein